MVADSLVVGALGAWLVPEVSERLPLLRAYARLLLNAGMRSGQVHTAGEDTAVSVWYERHLPRAAAGVTVEELHGALGRQADRFALLHACLAATIPAGPHAHLAVLAARPGRGQAAVALLEHHHRLLDNVGQPAYATLVTAEPRDSVLGQLGYVPRAPAQLAPAGPVLWRMWRSPRSQPRGLYPRRARLHQVTTPYWSGSAH
ncbi:N-acetyltransferase [Micromonospora sp. DT227]|uniref:N-acetyltransferase n=1 Tax=Micromonospora sp. DT227 TaxID=3393433 RepID=UPI003CF7FC65